MTYNKSNSTYHEVLLDKFGKSNTIRHRHFNVPMFMRYVDELKYPKYDTSNSKLSNIYLTK